GLVRAKVVRSTKRCVRSVKIGVAAVKLATAARSRASLMLLMRSRAAAWTSSGWRKSSEIARSWERLRDARFEILVWRSSAIAFLPTSACRQQVLDIPRVIADGHDALDELVGPSSRSEDPVRRRQQFRKRSVDRCEKAVVARQRLGRSAELRGDCPEFRDIGGDRAKLCVDQRNRGAIERLAGRRRHGLDPLQAKGRAGLRGAEHFVEALLEQPERACHGGIGRGRGGGYSAKSRGEILIDSILRPLQSSGRILPLDHVETLHVIAQTLDHDPDVRSALYQRITQRDAIAQLQRLSEYAPQRGKDRGGGPHDGGHRRPRDYCSERGYAAKSLVHLGQNVFCRLPRRDISQGLVVRFQNNHRLPSRSQGVYRSDDRATAIAVERGWPER